MDQEAEQQGVSDYGISSASAITRNAVHHYIIILYTGRETNFTWKQNWPEVHPIGFLLLCPAYYSILI